MPDLHSINVIVPSRGRPAAAAELIQAFDATCTADTFLTFVVDDTDPTRHDYLDVVMSAQHVDLVIAPSKTMVEALNVAAAGVNEYAVGFMGDDHRPRTVGWDRAYLDALLELRVGMVYGDDLFQHANIPTQIAMTTDIVKALGWMAPPALVHMYVDNWWLELGRRADCIRYLPDVVVEHVHPAAGKAGWDEGHVRVNQPTMFHQDGATFSRLRVLELPGAAAAVRALRSGT